MTPDWAVRESGRANVRRTIKRLLKKYKYPGNYKETIQLVVKQAEHWDTIRENQNMQGAWLGLMVYGCDILINKGFEWRRRDSPYSNIVENGSYSGVADENFINKIKLEEISAIDRLTILCLMMKIMF